MYRIAIEKLKNWKNSPNRKPLIIYGARQVGKTWLMQEFGQAQYQNIVYINFDESKTARELFSKNLIPETLISSLEAEYKTKIEPSNTLLLFDEIQECNRALVSLKYFCEQAPQYHIVAAGSLLGVAMHQGYSFPVGKVDIMTLYPLTFIEFLNAIGEEAFAKNIKERNFELIAGLKNRYAEFLKYYYYVGGMPQAVFEFSQNRNFEQARQVQKNILLSYQSDFSKHIAASDIPKVGLVWDCIPYQIAKDNNKFLYREIKQGARSREYENSIRWLLNSGIIHQLTCVNTPKLPLAAYQKREHFKLYMGDIGLLSCKSGLELKTVLEPNDNLFKEFKGALSEQFVIQELKALSDDLSLFYWASENTAEIDFIAQYNGQIIPIEVKSAENIQSKSLKVYMNLYNPKIALRSSLKNYCENKTLFEIPLYAIAEFKEIIDKAI
ncbi:MAG: ATP-binding protein [Elusimicrobiota bacterium]|nr:ATP-binding protein [Elusimicrobiota bacterium]